MASAHAICPSKPSVFVNGLDHSRHSERVVGRKWLDERREQLSGLLSAEDIGRIQGDDLADRGVVFPHILTHQAPPVVALDGQSVRPGERPPAPSIWRCARRTVLPRVPWSTETDNAAAAKT